MSNPNYTEHKERKSVASKGGKKKPETGGTPISRSPMTETTVNWPSAPSPSPGVGFNRKTKADVVKCHAKKDGMY